MQDFHRQQQFSPSERSKRNLSLWMVGYRVLCERLFCVIWPSVKHTNAQLREEHRRATSQHLDPDGCFDDLGISKTTFLVSALGSLLASLQYGEVKQMIQSQQLKINHGGNGTSALFSSSSVAWTLPKKPLHLNMIIIQCVTD